MRKFLVLALTALLVLAGCGGQFDPKVSQKTTVLKLNENYDPTDLIQDDENVGLRFEVVDNTINTSIPGDYTVEYVITSANGRQQVTRTFSFRVADGDAPVIVAEDEVTIAQGTVFTLSDYASAIDEREGDLTDRMTYSGDLNTFEPGDYAITLSCIDSFGNAAEKTLTVHVESAAAADILSKLAGDYTDTTYTDGQQPSMVLKADGTFTLYVNGCSLVSAVEGRFVAVGSRLYLTSDSSPFSSDPDQNLVMFTAQSDGSLVFSSETSFCAPSWGDVFVRDDAVQPE